jgi:lipoprotein-anchoring transpeptidase ErfK/SrfK
MSDLPESVTAFSESVHREGVSDVTRMRRPSCGRRIRKAGIPTTVALVAIVCSACTSTHGQGAATSTPQESTSTAVPATTPATTPPSTTSTTIPPPTTTTTPPPTTTTTVAASKNYLSVGSTGPAVTALQTRLASLGYWVGTTDGVFGDSTQQAVYALQKAAGIGRDGIVGPVTEAALKKGVVPHPLSAPGYVIEVDLHDDLVMFVNDGKLEYILNTSTGGGYSYNNGSGGIDIADTPTGVFHTYRAVDGVVTDFLGQLWMPRFFTGGFAIHGDSYVPPEPVSHGCVRVSDEAIEWIWAENLDPIGTTVWVY